MGRSSLATLHPETAAADGTQQATVLSRKVRRCLGHENGLFSAIRVREIPYVLALGQELGPGKRDRSDFGKMGGYPKGQAILSGSELIPDRRPLLAGYSRYYYRRHANLFRDFLQHFRRPKKRAALLTLRRGNSNSAQPPLGWPAQDSPPLRHGHIAHSMDASSSGCLRPGRWPTHGNVTGRLDLR